MSGERGRSAWPGGTGAEGTGAGFAVRQTHFRPTRAKPVTAEARPFDPPCYTEFFPSFFLHLLLDPNPSRGVADPVDGVRL